MNPALSAAVALGGALGSVMRYLVAIGVGRTFGTAFPWGILIINVTGSALIGVFAGLFALRWNSRRRRESFSRSASAGAIRRSPASRSTSGT